MCVCAAQQAHELTTKIKGLFTWQSSERTRRKIAAPCLTCKADFRQFLIDDAAGVRYSSDLNQLSSMTTSGSLPLFFWYCRQSNFFQGAWKLESHKPAA